MVAISVSAHARIRCEQVSTYFLGTFFFNSIPIDGSLILAGHFAGCENFDVV